MKEQGTLFDISETLPLFSGVAPGGADKVETYNPSRIPIHKQLTIEDTKEEICKQD